MAHYVSVPPFHANSKAFRGFVGPRHLRGVFLTDLMTSRTEGEAEFLPVAPVPLQLAADKLNTYVSLPSTLFDRQDLNGPFEIIISKSEGHV